MLFFNIHKDLKDVSVVLSQQADARLSAPAVITFTIHNKYKKSQKICKYQTPIEGFRADIFEIRDSENNRLDYNGVLVKRTRPRWSSYVKVQGSDVFSVNVDLKEAYPLDKKGTYTVKFIGNEDLNKLPNSNVLEIKIE